jgi:hypothetical protein
MTDRASDTTHTARTLFVAEAGDSPCAEARAHLPALGLQALGYPVDVTSVVYENVDGMLYGFDSEANKQLPRPKNLIVRHTRGPDGEDWDSVAMYEQARRKGQQIFFDVDDDLWHIPPWNPASEWVTEKVRRLVAANMNACDGVLASTAALATEVHKHTVAPVHVVRNGIIPDAYTPNRLERTPLRLAWFGATDWRARDLAVIVDALREALQGQRGKVEFWHVGFLADTPPVRVLLGDDFPVEIVEYPWVPLRLFPWVCRMIDCAVIPQTDHPFSQSRSSLMGLRLSAAGIPWAATATDEYERLWSAGAGYPVSDPGYWERAIAVLTRPEYEEARVGIRNGGLLVARNHRPEVMARQYEGLLA